MHTPTATSTSNICLPTSRKLCANVREEKEGSSSRTFYTLLAFLTALGQRFFFCIVFFLTKQWWWCKRRTDDVGPVTRVVQEVFTPGRWSALMTIDNNLSLFQPNALLDRKKKKKKLPVWEKNKTSGASDPTLHACSNFN